MTQDRFENPDRLRGIEKQMPNAHHVRHCLAP